MLPVHLEVCTIQIEISRYNWNIGDFAQYRWRVFISKNNTMSSFHSWGTHLCSKSWRIFTWRSAIDEWGRRSVISSATIFARIILEQEHSHWLLILMWNLSRVAVSPRVAELAMLFTTLFRASKAELLHNAAEPTERNCQDEWANSPWDKHSNGIYLKNN